MEHNNNKKIFKFLDYLIYILIQGYNNKSF